MYYIYVVMQQLSEAVLKFLEVALIAFVRKVLMGNKTHCEVLERALKCTSGVKPETEIYLSPFVLLSELMACSS